MIMKLVISGSRGATMDQFIKGWEQFTFKYPKPTMIIHGGCSSGVDLHASTWCKRNLIPEVIVPANWSMGKIAGLVRNAAMVRLGTHFLAIWDGQSRGTNNAIDEAWKFGLHGMVYDYVKNEVVEVLR